jgi:phytoene dehydrogenase-like protein
MGGADIHEILDIKMTKANGFDTWGPWFEGVNLLQAQEVGIVEVAAAKSKEIVIIGGGMSGLMTYLVLKQAGFTKIKIIEATNRLGGRILTEYVTGPPEAYSYQEMGAMRFPLYYKNPETNQVFNISDHQIVFDLAAEMNRLNGYDPATFINFTTWIQTNDNGLVYKNGFKLPTGLPPTVAQVRANPAFQDNSVLDPSTQQLKAGVASFMPGPEFYETMAKSMFRAHSEWLRRYISSSFSHAIANEVQKTA